MRRDIWEHLTQYLPAHMLPASVRLLPRLPLTSSGKVDRVALATGPIEGVEIPRQQAGRRHIDPPGKVRLGPHTDTLARLAELASGLQNTNLGPDDDLVQAGVTSLEAVRLAGEAWQRFGWNITGGQLLRLRTLREVAEHLAHDRQDFSGHDQGPALHVDISLAQRAMLALSYLDPSNTKTNILMRWQLDGPVDEARIRSALGTVVTHHPTLRTLYPLTADPVVLDSAHEQSLIVVRPDDGTGASSPDQLMQMPFDLEQMPPVRWLFDRSRPASTCLYAVLHHVAVDDAALATLHEALVTAYAGFPLPTEPSATRYSAVCATERRLLDERRQSDRAFWRSRRGSFDETTGLSKGHQRLTAARARRQAGILPGGATMMQRMARSMDVTAYSLFLAATSSTIARALGGSSVLVGVPVSSREAVGGEGLLGCFANLVPLAIRDHGEDVARTIQDSHAAVLLGLDHGLLPFAEIARLAELPRDDTGDRAPSFVCQLASVPQPAVARGVVFSPAFEQPARAFYPVIVRGETSSGDLTVYTDYDPGAIDDDLAQHLIQEQLRTLERFSQRQPARNGQ
jgi:aryl carrier-like protein